MTSVDELDPKAIMEEYVRNRGDIFDEWHFMAEYVPLTIVRLHDAAGYVLQNDNKSTPDQELSLVFRELIALCHLSAKGNPRFAANHVRRLYRNGVTNAVMFEAVEAMSAVVGHSTIAHVAEAILLANDPDYPFGKLPEGGEPAELTPFPEMQLGWESRTEQPASIADAEVWRFCAEIDPELARRSAAYIDHCVTDRRPERVLSPGARELVIIAALCARGLGEHAVERIKRAYDYGFSRRQVLEAISVIHNMHGSVSVEIGLRAMMRAEGRPV